MNNYHISVLLKEAVDLLNVKKGNKYIDATLGGGGHASEILSHGGNVLGLDVDQDALSYVNQKLNSQILGKKLILAKGNFKNIDEIAKKNGFEKVAGIIFDLGVSSHQLEVAERGFSFQKDGPLDMRMDRDLSVKAWDLVNSLTRGELYELFTKFGEERFARPISESIVNERKIAPIVTTLELVEIIRQVVPRQNKDINPATKVFQALRMAINDEQNVIREALPKALSIIENNGRIVIISFQSLEDRIIKNQFKDWEKTGLGKIVTKKPIIPTDEEINKNKRSRSSKLRVFEKV